MSNRILGRRTKQIGFDEGIAELEAENSRKKEKLIHVILHGEDAEVSEAYISDYPPKNPAEGQLWLRTSDSAMLLWYIDSHKGTGAWVKTYDK